MTDVDPAAAADTGSSNGSATPKPRAARSTSRKNTGAKSGPKPVSELDGMRARLEGVEPVINNAFHASGAALLLSVLALALAVFLLFRVRGLAPAAAKAVRSAAK